MVARTFPLRDDKRWPLDQSETKYEKTIRMVTLVKAMSKKLLCSARDLLCDSFAMQKYM